MKLKNFNLKKSFYYCRSEVTITKVISIAKKLVRQTAKAGADAVKFQTFKTENFIRKKDKDSAIKKI